MGRNRQVDKYEEADTSFVINQDESLKAIRISLPKPPKKELIDGYGLPPQEQKFKRLEMPYKLKRLEDIAAEKTKAYTEKARQSITQFKISKTFWNELRDNIDYYREEIKWIKKVWWHRLHGYWFYNNGKPTYIDGWHFMYLNFWYMPDVKPDGYPQYRDRDRKEFLFSRYAFTTNETFKNLDEKGMAVPNKDGSYEMVELKGKTCLGIVTPKNRRVGWTNKSLLVGMEINSRTLGTDGGGIMSYTDDNAASHFKTKLMPAWRRWPLFFKPYTVSSMQSNELVFDLPKNEHLEDSLQTKINYATTSDARFYDGKKLVYCLCDESGKHTNTDVAERWGVLRNCLSLGGGSDIIGFSIHPSTVEEYTSGGKAYRELVDDSNFYNRIKGTGQTPSGLFLSFINSTEGLEGHIDEYGYSKKDSALKYIQSQMKHYIRENTPEAMKRLREWKKQFPLQFKDCWLGESGDIGWNMQIIDKALQDAYELKGEDKPVRGNFYWDNNVRATKVVFRSDPNGKWEVSNFLKEYSNKKAQEVWYDHIEQEEKLIWRPLYGWRVTIGVDPYKPNTAAEIKKGIGEKWSKGSMVVKWERDVSIDQKEIKSEWKSDTIVCTYLHRPQNYDEFIDDVIKTAVYYGGMIFPEMNIEGFVNDIRKEGYYGYVKYFIDDTGLQRDKPGLYMNHSTKPKAFNYGRDYIELRGHTIKHVKLLEQLKDIPSIDALNDYDLVAAFLLAEYGSQSKHGQVIRQQTEVSKIDPYQAIQRLRGWRKKIV